MSNISCGPRSVSAPVPRSDVSKGRQAALQMALGNQRYLLRQFEVRFRITGYGTINRSENSRFGIRTTSCYPSVTIQAQLKLRATAPKKLRGILPEFVIGMPVKVESRQQRVEGETLANDPAIRAVALAQGFELIGLLVQHYERNGIQDQREKVLHPPNMVISKRGSWFYNPRIWMKVA